MEVKKFHHRRWLRHLISAPFIYSLFFPLFVFDIFLEIYHHISFPLYGLQKVERSGYIKFDRHRLQYLNPLDKFNCTFCAYANGLLGYAAAIAGETEWYWCSIRHEKTKGFVEPAHHKDFLPHNDERAFHKFVKEEKY